MFISGLIYRYTMSLLTRGCPLKKKQTLGDLRKNVGNTATVLGFVGLPYTLATYLIEGGNFIS
jgi:hypothetical protein